MDPVQNLGVRAVTFYGGCQCGFPSVRVRKEDVPNTEWVQLLLQREDCSNIQSGAGPGSVRGFLGESIQE